MSFTEVGTDYIVHASGEKLGLVSDVDLDSPPPEGFVVWMERLWDIASDSLRSKCVDLVQHAATQKAAGTPLVLADTIRSGEYPWQVRTKADISVRARCIVHLLL